MSFLDKFPVQDITHHTKMIQGDWGEDDSTNNDYEVKKIPSSMTVESLISYFKENAKGQFARPYNQAAKYLEDYKEKRIFLAKMEREEKLKAIRAEEEKNTLENKVKEIDEDVSE